MSRSLSICVAVAGLAVMLALRGASLPGWAAITIYPAVCVTTMVFGMRALDRDPAEREPDPAEQPAAD